MPGNELMICEFLIRNIGIELDHIGRIETIGSPSGESIHHISSIEALCRVAPENSRKKADIYINDIGVSLKQRGGGFSYNRLQRANLYDVYSLLGFANIEQKLHQIDNEVRRFHAGLLDRRNRPWEDFFDRNDFKDLLEYLMMNGAPNVGLSSHPASLILEAPSGGISVQNVSVYTFDEYFEKYMEKFKIAIRRQWIGQASNSEHNRAVGLASKAGNKPWVFDNVVGAPRSGWRQNIAPNERKTVYFLMIEKVV